MKWLDHILGKKIKTTQVMFEDEYLCEDIKEIRPIDHKKVLEQGKDIILEGLRRIRYW